VHSLVHSLINEIELRFGVFGISSRVLLVLTVRAALVVSGWRFGVALAEAPHEGDRQSHRRRQQRRDRPGGNDQKHGDDEQGELPQDGRRQQERAEVEQQERQDDDKMIGPARARPGRPRATSIRAPTPRSEGRPTGVR
jgi:hypothetical protein